MFKPTVRFDGNVHEVLRLAVNWLIEHNYISHLWWCRLRANRDDTDYLQSVFEFNGYCIDDDSDDEHCDDSDNECGDECSECGECDGHTWDEKDMMYMHELEWSERQPFVKPEGDDDDMYSMETFKQEVFSLTTTSITSFIRFIRYNPRGYVTRYRHTWKFRSSFHASTGKCSIVILTNEGV